MKYVYRFASFFLWVHNTQRISGIYSFISFRVASLAPGQSYNWFRVSEVTLTSMATTIQNYYKTHDYVIEWKHFSRYWSFVRGIQRSPVNSPHKGQGRGALVFSLTCAWINSWVNNSEAGDLRRHRAHYDVILMTTKCEMYGYSLGRHVSVLCISMS